MIDGRLSPKTHRLGLLLPGLLTGAILAGIAIWLVLLPQATGLVRSSYDLLHWIARGELPQPFPVAIVYIDLPSHIRLKQDPAQPWPRTLHAQLIRRLKQAGARAVIFDVLFAELGNDPRADQELAAAMREHGQVILGAEWNRGGREGASGVGFDERSVVLPAELFRKAAAGYGFVFSKVDSDFEVREEFPGFLDRDLPSLSWAAARSLGQAQPPLNGWVRYYGPPVTLPHVSIADALEASAVPDEFFQNKVVFVGARPEAGRFDERRDELRNPFSALARGILFMPGVEVHATQMANLLRQEGLARLPRTQEVALLAFTGLALGVGLLRVRPLTGGLIALGGEFVVVAGAAFAFRQFGLWFPWLIVGAVQIPGAWLASLAAETRSWYAERRRYLSRIRQQAALIEKAQDAIVVYDLEGPLLFRNPKAVELFGATVPSLHSKELEAARATALQNGEWTGEMVHNHRVLLSHWTLLRDEQGAPKQLLQIHTDVTEEKRLQEQFSRAQRLESIWATAGGMAHDLNNALAPVIMGLQRLEKKVDRTDQHELISVMQDAARRSAEMVQQVLALARQRSIEHVLLRPGELLHQLEQALAFLLPETISASFLCPPDIWGFRGNQTQIHQVLLNLCLNARDAMSTGGELTIAADNVSLAEKEVGKLQGAAPGEYVLLIVADTGSGIPAELLPRLFEPFATGKPAGRGTGLGLFTALHIIRSHRGFLHVESEPGTGTTFEIYLPRAESPETGPPSRE